jgi:hypothetical protein
MALRRSLSPLPRLEIMTFTPQSRRRREPSQSTATTPRSGTQLPSYLIELERCQEHIRRLDAQSARLQREIELIKAKSRPHPGAADAARPLQLLPARACPAPRQA